MGVVAPAARSFCRGVLRRVAPIHSDNTSSGRAFMTTNKPRGVTPPVCGVMRARDSSACRAGAGGGVCVTKKEIVNGVQVQVEVIPAGGKRPLYSAPGHLRGVLARDPSVCLAAVEVFSFSVPTRKRTKRTRSIVEAEADVLTVAGEKPVDPALDRLRKRMALELEAVRELLKKSELVPRRPACKSRWLRGPEPRMEAGGKTPSLKRRKVAQSAEPRKKVQDAQCAAAPKAAVCLPGVLFRAKVRRELLKMERAVLPDESINQRDLQRLSIAEYGRPSVMRQLGLFLIKADA